MYFNVISNIDIKTRFAIKIEIKYLTNLFYFERMF
jgi:hypothetical protein